MSKKKKIILLVSMIAVLVVAVYINIKVLSNKTLDEDPTAAASANFFSTYRTNRQATRSYEIEQLDEIINIEGDEYSDARADAMDQKLRLVQVTELEMILETLLIAQGFEDAVVSIGTTSDNINIIVTADELTREQTAIIYNIITSETSTTTDYIRILAI
ncbi:MAG: SpoIIIAH-like family protein [Clostridia bacterium]|nr:SpoIIIAH-like family protein [Clostridia bacterium]